MLLTLAQGQVQQVVFSAAAGRKPAISSYVLANRDLQSPIFIGFADQGDQQPDLVTPDPKVTSQVDPLGSVQLDTTLDWFAVSPSGDVQVDLVPNSNYWTPSPFQAATQILPLAAAIAQQIAATGIPVIPAPTIIYNL